MRKKRPAKPRVEYGCTCNASAIGPIPPHGGCKAHPRAAAKAKADREATLLEKGQSIAILANAITSEREFIALMQQVKPELREDVYNQISPHVGYAGVRPFALIPFDLDS